MNQKTDTIKPSRQVTYSFTIGENLHKKVEKHIHMLKCLEDRSLSKQRWIVDAIKEKLEFEESLGPDEFSKERFLNAKIDDRLDSKVEKRVDFHKNFRKSYSKKSWILEAVHEKLDRDESLIQDLLNEQTNA